MPRPEDADQTAETTQPEIPAHSGEDTIPESAMLCVAAAAPEPWINADPDLKPVEAAAAHEESSPSIIAHPVPEPQSDYLAIESPEPRDESTPLAADSVLEPIAVFPAAETAATFQQPGAPSATLGPAAGSSPAPLQPDATDASAEAHGPADRLADRIDWEQVKSIGVRAYKVAAIVFCAWLATALLLIAVYRFINPPVSAMMVLRWMSGTGISRDWVPLQDISPNLVRAVIASEDDRFCSHWGIDFDAIGAAIRRSSKGPPRGASTITMQVSKNLFLWPAKSYLRKLLEVPLTYAIELMWPKRRILEVYLNIAEWGPGIFGAEAASRAHFGAPARWLSSRQAALLAVALPNPHVRNAGRPGRWTSGRAAVIQRRAAGLGSGAACVLGER